MNAREVHSCKATGAQTFTTYGTPCSRTKGSAVPLLAARRRPEKAVGLASFAPTLRANECICTISPSGKARQIGFEDAASVTSIKPMSEGYSPSRAVWTITRPLRRSTDMLGRCHQRWLTAPIKVNSARVPRTARAMVRTISPFVVGSLCQHVTDHPQPDAEAPPQRKQSFATQLEAMAIDHCLVTEHWLPAVSEPPESGTGFNKTVILATDGFESMTRALCGYETTRTVSLSHLRATS